MAPPLMLLLVDCQSCGQAALPGRNHTGAFNPHLGKNSRQATEPLPQIPNHFGRRSASCGSIMSWWKHPRSRISGLRRYATYQCAWRPLLDELANGRMLFLALRGSADVRAVREHVFRLLSSFSVVCDRVESQYLQ